MNEKEDKKSKKLVVIITLLILIIIGLLGYIVYDKIISKDNGKDNGKDNISIEDKKESTSNEKGRNSLKGNVYNLSLENDNNDKYYFKFINDTEYECLIRNTESNDGNVDYISSGKYTFDGKNIKVSDENIDITFKESMLYINVNNYSIMNEGKYYEVYFNKNIIKQEFEKIGLAAANTRKDEWNNNNSVKMIKTEGNVDWCYKIEGDNDTIACSINIKQFFKEYDKNKCENDSTSAYAISTISSGRCGEGYSTYWSFSSVDKKENGYNVYGSWTGI